MIDIDAPLDLVQALIPIAEKAGEEILAVYTTPFAVESKADHSPVTEADRRAEAVIIEALTRLTPAIPIVAEEAVAAGHIPVVGDQPFWLVDPLDGTKEFVKRNGEFTVNIGLVVGGLPVLGVVHCPALEITYWGAGLGHAVIRSRHSTRTITCRPQPEDGLTVLASRSHGSDDEMTTFLAAFPVKARIAAGSSLKFCRIAEGIADLYPRLGPTYEWDTCAAHAVLRAAGGGVFTLDGQPLAYAKRGDFLNPPFVARGLPA
ncbi:3'(2'),5'-bisphosphate nucleotidase [Rhodospirillum rubrum]|uniref:3'(2'),5'-bisphosphate nucleotidase CysQ n=1 Tax=Rhodospirillum rubrum TaxID=1085 RepID=UPI00190572D8|nr:3'(2'),5'-bisphosphate nucleotidase CysQ [Rhodospirillum rubrum]MBK1663395.1 3'(2'),5'-bisphosphate nucleotidase [Rhodospirillum rubrum]MBK1675567.1 3'(2'),5'-bisphosphate nucleotidase [Rhodospirillum rubrum]